MKRHAMIVAALIVSISLWLMASACGTSQPNSSYASMALVFPDAGHAWATADVWSHDRYEITGGAILAATSSGAIWHRQQAPSAWSSPSELAFANDRCGWVLGAEDMHPPLLATTNGGATWTAQNVDRLNPNGDLNDIACADARHAWIVGDTDGHDGVILATTDGGLTWEKQALTTTGYLEAAAFADARHGWAVGGGVILATTDGGRTWTRQLSGSNYGLESVACAGARRAWAMGVGADNKNIVLGTTDGGATWKTLFATQAGEWQSMVFADASHGWIVGDDGLILATSDGGKTWARQASGTTMNLLCVAFADRTHGLAAGDRIEGSDPMAGKLAGSILLRTTDGGATWTR